MNSQRFIGALEENGFDRATAETIVKMSDAKPIQEAQTLLEGMVGDQRSLIESYIASRRHADEVKQKLSAHVTVKKVRESKHSSTSSSSASSKISNAEKVDSLRELEAAVQRLSVSSPDRKECDCMGSIHGLSEMAPNCLSCGRIVCNKEGLGPCLFCKEPLLPTDRIKQIVDILTDQKNSVIATMSKKALVAAGVDPAAKQDVSTMFTSSAEAEANLERLLGYQDNDSVRTRIIDQVAEVDLPNEGVNQWATAFEQAEHLRLQQRRLRKLERERKARSGQGRKVLSIDVRGNKVYQTIEDAPLESEDDEPEDEERETGHVGESGRPPTKDAYDDIPKPVLYYDVKPFSKFKAPKYKPADALASSGKAPEDTCTKVHIRREANEDLLY